MGAIYRPFYWCARVLIERQTDWVNRVACSSLDNLAVLANHIGAPSKHTVPRAGTPSMLAFSVVKLLKPSFCRFHESKLDLPLSLPDY